MSKCDCLNFCGDDERVRNNKALRCERYDRLNRYSNNPHDAMLFRTINEKPRRCHARETGEGL